MSNSSVLVGGVPESPAPAYVSLVDLVSLEVDEWYRLFFRWSRGLCSNDETHVRPLYDALGRDFEVVLGNGDVMNKAEYWGRLQQLYAQREDVPPSHLLNLQLRRVERDHVLATFELGKHGLCRMKRVSALLRRTPRTFGGVEWVHVQESAYWVAVPPHLGDNAAPCAGLLRGEALAFDGTLPANELVSPAEPVA